MFDTKFLIIILYYNENFRFYFQEKEKENI